jgi:hypothetical protein
MSLGMVMISTYSHPQWISVGMYDLLAMNGLPNCVGGGIEGMGFAGLPHIWH